MARVIMEAGKSNRTVGQHVFESEVDLSQDDKRVIEIYRGTQLQNVSTASVSFPSVDSPIVLSVVRNERDHLGQFLAHYRGLGAELFAIVDNGSVDGSREFLAAQPDVDLFSIGAPFEWHAKQAWINRLIDYYGIERWFLHADADEQLVYDDYQNRSLREVVSRVQTMGVRRVRGFLTDMYSDLPLALAADEAVSLHEAYPFFDRVGYCEERLPYIVSRTGGPRLRAFGAIDHRLRPQLTKYPLFRMRPGELFANPHHFWPCEANFRSPCLLAILHFKFHGGWLEKVMRAVQEGSYWEGSREYRAYAAALKKDPGLSLFSEVSSRFTGSEDLIEAGLIQPLEWLNGRGRSSIDRVSLETRRRRSSRLAALGAGATAATPIPASDEQR